MATIVTFYSYKGGTGRSMALANVAWILASGGRRVLVLDWDLEAPGLHHYFRPFLPDPDLLAMDVRGVIDFVFEYVAAAATPPPHTSDGRTARPKEWYKPYADITQCAIPLCWPSGERVRFGKNGGIDFIPAGRQIPDVYAARVNGFNWAHFYDHQSGGAFMDAVRDSMQGYDYVLIDSRTGVSDTAGICTVQMPDMLVLCFTLNNQSIKGASGIAAQLARALNGKPVLPVPMRIDPFEKDKLNKRREYAHRVFEKLVGALSEKLEVDPERYWSDVEIPYFASYAYEETLAPFEKFSGSLGSMLPALEKLTGYISGNTVSRFSAVISEAQRDAVVAVYQETGSAGSGSPPAGQPGLADSAARDITLRELLQFVRRQWIVSAIVIAGLASVLVLMRWGTSPPPQRPETPLAAAYRLREAGNVDGAIATLTRALATEQDPALRSRMFRDRAYAYKLQEKWTASIEDLSQARELDANGSELEDRAFAYLKTTDLEAAIRDYADAGDRNTEALLRGVLTTTQQSNVFLFLPVASASKIPDVPLGYRYVNRRFWWHPFVNQIRYTDSADEKVARGIAGRLDQSRISVAAPVAISALATKGRRIEVWLNDPPDAAYAAKDGHALSLVELAAIMPGSTQQLRAAYLGPISAAMTEFAIDTPLRQAHFLGELSHESGDLRGVVETWTGSSSQLRYENMKSLGNSEPGDGERYRGRGLFWIVGRGNYLSYGAALGLDLVKQPDLAARPDVAARTAGLFWKRNRLNDLADADDILGISRRIGSGTQVEARTVAVRRAKAALGVPASPAR